MRINQDFIMVVMAGAGLLLVLALCMAALYKWISFLGGKMTRYGMHVHQMLKTDESDNENGNKVIGITEYDTIEEALEDIRNKLGR